MDNHTIHKIEENHIYKQCSKCEKNLSINNYHNCKGGKYGKHSICKVCRRLRETDNILFNDIRCCPKCNIRKGIIDFYANNPTNCKECHKLAISNSLSKLIPYLKMLLKKFGKKHNKKVLNFNIDSLIRKYRLLDGKCEISGVVMEHIVNKKQQFDNIWNIAILYNSPTEDINIIEIDHIQLVCHLAKTMSTLYKMSVEDIKLSIGKIK